jgi:predicted HTH domain antitoxin
MSIVKKGEVRNKDKLTIYISKKIVKRIRKLSKGKVSEFFESIAVAFLEEKGDD